GTLGIITQLTLKVRPIPEKSTIVWVDAKDDRGLAETLDRLNVSGTRPIAVELLNLAGARSVAAPLGLPIGGANLALGFEGTETAVAWQIDQLKDELKSADLSIVDDDRAPALWAGLVEFQAQSPGPVSFVANVRPGSVVSFMGTLDASRWSVQAHA